MNGLICPDSIPSFLGFFDFSIAPPLLFYAYIPVVFLALLLGLFIFISSKDRLVAGLLFSIGLLFSLHTFSQIFQWVTVYSNIVLLSWNILAVIEMLIYVSFIYFVYVFVNKKDLRLRSKTLLLIAILPVLFNFIFKKESFDLLNCEGIFEPIWYYIYAFEIVSIFIVIFICLRSILNKNNEDQVLKKQTNLVLFGSVLFLGIFSATNIFGDLMLTYEINLLGPIGMILFLAFLSYLIVRFKAFDIKLISAQALTWVLIILIGSQFFFVKITINYYLTGIAFLGVIIAGSMIVRNVKSEIAQKNKIELLAEDLAATNTDLEEANEKLKGLDAMKSEFVSLATHQIRGPIAAIKGYVSLLEEGDYGEVPQTFKDPLDTVFKSIDSLSRMVTDFLDVSRLDLGQMKYEFGDFDFRDLVNEVMKELSPGIKAKGLDLRINITDTSCPIKADRVKLKQVLNNLVDNSTKYTKQGFMEISVENKGGKTLFAVKDSGVGISEKTIAVLFQRFSRAKNANEVNILGTGLGLYVAKKMAEANSGRVWAESAGEGKGAQFYVELPLRS